MKKYSDYKNSSVPWIGEIPTTWNLSQLRYVIECLDGKRVPVELSLRADMQGNIPYWGAGNIVDYVDKALFDEELVLLGEDGAPFFDHTRPVAFHITEPIWANNHIHVLRIKENADPKYIVYVLNAVDYKEYSGKAKAMVVTGSRLHAVRYYQEFQRYIKKMGYENELGILIAFSGKVLEQIVSDMDANEELRIQARNNSQEHFRFPFNDAFMDVVIGRMAQNQQFCERVLDDAKFGDTVRDLLIGVVYDRLRRPTDAQL